MSTLKVISMLNCHTLGSAFDEPLSDPTIRQSVVVCRILLTLQQMFNFSISYEYRNIDKLLYGKQEITILNELRNGSADVYTRAMSLRPELLDFAQPVHEIYSWRVGFILRRPDHGIFGSFFRDPFQMPVWYCIYVSTVLIMIFFYILRLFEKRLVKSTREDECSLSHEILVMMSSVCQTSIPINPVLPARRTAYTSYFMFNYVMYSFYTSNLLYHLVNIKTKPMDIKGLADSSYKCTILNTASLNNVFKFELDEGINYLVKKKFKTIEYVNPKDGLEAVRDGTSALLSDYLSLYPNIKTMFPDDVICQLIEVDLYSDLKKYIWISKTCKLRENIKIGILRIMEVGILERISRVREPSPPRCTTSPHVRAHLTHIMAPLTMLLTVCVVCLLMLVIECKSVSRQPRLPYIN